MKRPTLSLVYGGKFNVVQCPEPSRVTVPLEGHGTKTVRKRSDVARGALVAEHPDAGVGDVHAPIPGKLVDIDEKELTIAAGEVEGAPEPLDTSGLTGEELRGALKRLGVSTRGLVKSWTIVVNGLNPEPGTAMAEYLLQNQTSRLARGLQAVKSLSGASSCFLVVSSNQPGDLDGCKPVFVRGVYPESLPPLVVKAATGKELPVDVLCVDTPTLYRIGLVLETGLPLTEVLVGVGGTIVQARVGQPVSDVLHAAGTQAGEGDSVVVGGPFCGEAVSHTGKGLPKDAFALTVVRAGSFPPVSDNACLNCGSCVAHCPARIRPNMIGRYAEFKLYAKTKNYGIEQCFECGLCAYWCPGRRPLMQYIRLTRSELAEQARRFTSCVLNE